MPYRNLPIYLSIITFPTMMANGMVQARQLLSPPALQAHERELATTVDHARRVEFPVQLLVDLKSSIHFFVTSPSPSFIATACALRALLLEFKRILPPSTPIEAGGSPAPQNEALRPSVPGVLEMPSSEFPPLFSLDDEELFAPDRIKRISQSSKQKTKATMLHCQGFIDILCIALPLLEAYEDPFYTIDDFDHTLLVTKLRALECSINQIQRDKADGSPLPLQAPLLSAATMCQPLFMPSSEKVSGNPALKSQAPDLTKKRDLLAEGVSASRQEKAKRPRSSFKWHANKWHANFDGNSLNPLLKKKAVSIGDQSHRDDNAIMARILEASGDPEDWNAQTVESQLLEKGIHLPFDRIHRYVALRRTNALKKKESSK